MIHFIGAGPGAPDLLTLRGAELIARCPVVIYAGSLVPAAVVAGARPDARVVDSARLSLDQIVAELARADAAGEDVARVHTGDPSLFGAVAEQMRRLDALGIPYDVVPGVSSFTAAAAALRRELTVPGISQAVIIARVAGRTPVPAGQELGALAAHRATLALFLSAGALGEVAAALRPAYGAECPAAVVHRASWPDQRIVEGTLSTIAGEAARAGIDRTAMVLVGPALAASGFPDSRLYAPDFAHGFRGAPAAHEEEPRD